MSLSVTLACCCSKSHVAAIRIAVVLSLRGMHRHPPRATSLIAGAEGTGGVCGLSIIHGPLPEPETWPRLLALGSIRYIRGPISSPRMRRGSRGGSPPLTFMGNRASVSITEHRSQDFAYTPIFRYLRVLMWIWSIHDFVCWMMNI